MPDSPLEVDLAGIRPRSPLLLAAGTAGTLDEASDVLDLSRVGGVVTKSITAEARTGNDARRMLGTRAGMLNAIGLANVGIDDFIEYVVPRIPTVPTRVIASVAGFATEDYVRVCAALDDVDGLAAVELNVSCPNVQGGVEFGADPGLLRGLIGAVRPVLSTTRLFVKLPPVTSDPPGIRVARPGRNRGNRERRRAL